MPTYAAYGQAQLGVVGYDVLKEHQLPVAQLVDLGFEDAAWPWRFRRAVAPVLLIRRPIAGGQQIHPLRQEYFDALDLPVELVHRNGSSWGRSQGCRRRLWIWSHGRTLRDNGLIAIEDLSSRRLDWWGTPVRSPGQMPLASIVEAIRAAATLVGSSS